MVLLGLLIGFLIGYIIIYFNPKLVADTFLFMDSVLKAIAK